ncbi:hypothetical protein EI982_04755 [Haloplanus rallus]|jgi:hypothetical protein|uniref:DUF7998 domain-containing protein n=1 Tax=Haloplanus rallus TaxID=1816183 RepID=A0A6B9FCY5_9EURY|nr:hypothetical protein [Haloplanus rallus]QGX94140.1 hypothetical protein EI982_04755 [Haloplanus rallus]
MPLVPRPWSSDSDDFDDDDSFRPENLPAPGPFLDGHEVLTGRRHAAFHRLTRERFEERTVYDVTFGYNLARLNLDTRHPNAGYRYAVDADDPSVLRTEFTPTTEFCPQSDTLVTASFRAWNADDVGSPHEFDLVCVRVAPMHESSVRINDRLADMEAAYLDSGSVPDDEGDGERGTLAGAGDRGLGGVDDMPADEGEDGPSTPF